MRGREDGSNKPLAESAGTSADAGEPVRTQHVTLVTKSANNAATGSPSSTSNPSDNSSADNSTQFQCNVVTSEPTTAVSGNNVVDEERSWVFKINDHPTINTGNLPQGLQFVIDSKTHLLFLIDTGSEISLIPQSLTNGVNRHFSPQSRVIQGIGNTDVIHPIGSVDLSIKLEGLGPIEHEFWVTQEHRSYGIIGLDILIANNLVMSPATSELGSITSGGRAKLFTPSQLPPQVVVTVSVVQNLRQSFSSLEERCEAVLAVFPEITKKPDYNVPPKHGHTLEIVVDDYRPKMTKARRCGGTREVIKQHFADLLERGAVVRGSADAGASPVTCVPKKNNTFRVCVDYTTLNKFTRPLSYPLPRIDELSEVIPGGTQFFSTLDLKEAYYNLPIEEKSRKLAAIITHRGVFIPKRCTFGLKNAPTRFQQMMEDMFMGCEGYTFIYLDDILVFSATETEHIAHLWRVFKVLSKNGLCLNTEKNVLAKSQVVFLGHNVGITGINVLEQKVRAIRDLPVPNTRKELKRFIGMVNFYHRFVPNIAEVMAPLNEISGGSKSTNRVRIALNSIQMQAFIDTKDTLANAVTLTFEDHNKSLILSTDASDTHVGAVLEQRDNDGKLQPLAFFSKKLPLLKVVRSTFYKELRALYMSLKYFQCRILGRDFIVRTDNKALVSAIEKEARDQSPMELRYIMAIKEFNPRIEHIAGTDNIVADALSRPPQMTAMYVRRVEQDPDYYEDSDTDSELSISENESTNGEDEIIGPDFLNEEDISLFQRKEPELIREALDANLKVDVIQPGHLAVVVDGGNKRVILPYPLRLTAFNNAHQTLHLGIEKSILAVAKDFWWPSLKQDVEHWTRSCIECQVVKISRYNKPKLGFYPNKSERLQFVHMDLVGPMEEASDGNKYILTAKDRGTGFLVTVPIPNKRAVTVRNAFVQHWCGVFGIPSIVVTDNGSEFVNSHMADMFSQLGVEHRLVPPYSPQSNGYIERQHRSIVQALRADSQKSCWALRLPMITASINNTPIQGSPFTPAQYTFGTSINLPGQVLVDKVSENGILPEPEDTKIFLNIMARLSRNHKKYVNKNVHYESSLFECDKVWVQRPNRKKLNTLYHGPYRVVERTPHSFYIEKHNKVVKVGIGNIKAFIPRENLINDRNKCNNENKIYNLRNTTKINYAEDSEDEF